MTQLEEIKLRMKKIKDLQNKLNDTNDTEEIDSIFITMSSLLLDQMDLMW